MRHFCFSRFALDVERTNLARNLAATRGTQIAPLNREQFALDRSLFCFQLGILLSRPGLPIQMRQIALELISQIGQTLQVLRGAAHTAFSLAPPLLVLGNAGSLFDENPQFLGLGLDQPRHHALLDNGVTPRAPDRSRETNQ